ncbi:Asperfuranone cluster transcription factor afoA [Talaromyces pinophilus]|nr:Asperfuranone cluster transcription factor afoA [Talaromyces pinophilus]
MERATPTFGRLACDICRERKVRCDRGVPKCGRCARLDYDCNYQGRKRYRAAQADMSRQLSELRTRLCKSFLAQEHLLFGGHVSLFFTSTGLSLILFASTTTTTTACPLPPHMDLTWPVPTPPERLGTHEGLTQRLQSQVTPPMDRAFEGLGMLANLTEDIPDFWGVMDSVLAPDELSTVLADDSTKMQTPFDGSYPPAANGSSVSPDFGSSISPSTHELEEPIRMSDLASLHQKYFDIFYPVLPILNPSRFRREWAHDPCSPQIRALSYAVALVGSTVAPEYAHLQSTCYKNARKYIELCERSDDETHITSLNAFQALLFVLRHELTRKHFVRAWMTLGRAVTLAQILNLRHIDKGEAATQRTGPPQDAREIKSAWDVRDPASLEEIRRSFWSLYIFESYGCVRTGRPCTLEEDNLCVFLPSPGELNEAFRPSPMPFISDPTKLAGVSYLTSYAAVIIMVKLARLCFEHVGILSRSVSDSGFWDRHYRLVKTINDYTAVFQRYLTAKAVREDALAFSLHLNLCATHINLHEAAIHKVEEQDLPKLVSAESRKCSTAAAFKILGAIRMNWPVQRSERDHFSLQATFIGWPISMSLIALSRSLANGDTTPIGIVDSLRLLRAALDQVEEPDWYWHQASGAVVTALAKWDEQQHESHSSE